MGTCVGKEKPVGLKIIKKCSRGSSTSLGEIVEAQNSKRQQKLRKTTVIRRNFIQRVDD